MHLLHIFKRSVKVLGITVLCLLLVGFLLGVFYEREIKELILREVNERVQTKIHVGEFDLSVLRHFPYASFVMKEVVVEENSDALIKDTLLYSGKLSMLFNMMDLFSKDIAVQKILITDGTINIRIDKNGKDNYHFWKKATDSSRTGAIDLQKIILSNVKLNYFDLKAHQDYAMLAKDADLSGHFGDEEFTLKTKASLFVDHLTSHGVNYVDQKPVEINSGLNVNSQSGLYTFSESRIKIDGVSFDVHGQVSEYPAWLLDLAVKANECDIPSLIKIIPPEYTAVLLDYKINGRIEISSIIKGGINKKSNPLVKIDFKVKNGKIEARGGGAEFEKLNFAGTFVNAHDREVSMLNIPALSASVSGHAIKASLRLDNLPDAYLTLNAKTQLNLKELRSFIPADTLESLSGDLAMNISYAGKIRDLSQKNAGKLNNIKASGDIDISHVYFKLKNNPLKFENLCGNFSLHNNDVYVKNFSGKISSSDFRLDGVFRNFVSFLLIPGQPGNVQATLVADKVNLDELLINKSASTENDTSYILKFNPRLLCDLDVSIRSLKFRKFEAEDISGRVNLNRQIIVGRGLQFKAMDGDVAMDATINTARRDSLSMDYEAKFTQVDITKLFYELENFDQQTITDRNVKGRISADVQFISMWSKDLTINSKSVRSTGNIVIENGELINFAPIQALAKYIHAADLNHIKFSTLKNTISIANRKIYIPNMDINSSAINISANGIHDFDNTVDYHLQLLLSDILGKKVRNNTTEFGEVEDDGLGRTKLFLSMKGPVYEPKFAYDRKAAGEKIKNDIAEEKQNLKGLLKQEFGFYKNEPSVQVPKPKKREEMQIDWSQE